MLEQLFGSGPLNIVYTGAVLISLVFAALTLLGAEAGDALDFDLDADVEGDIDFVSISPFALAMFGATFGVIGLITNIWLEMDTVPSVLWASAAGLVIGVAAQAFFIYILSPSKSSHFSLSDDATGREAEVIITIPGNGQGRIAYDNISGRVTLGARSATGRQIKSGQFVKIERITGRVAVVQPLDAE